MIQAVFGTKLIQEQTWTQSGGRLPVTLIKIFPMTVTQKKIRDKDGYQTIQVGFGGKKREMRVESGEEIKVGDVIEAETIFKPGDLVKVTGRSRGKGFTGVVKRWGFKGGPKTHGQSDRHRAPGSIGQGTDPGRVHKGKRMAGRSGGNTVTIRNLVVVKIGQGQMWVKGLVPGSRGSMLRLTKLGVAKKYEPLTFGEEVKNED